MPKTATNSAIIGEPEVVEDIVNHPAWLALKNAAASIRPLQLQDGSIPDSKQHADARKSVDTITASIEQLAPSFPHDEAYLSALVTDFERWAADGFGVPDFLDSLLAFQPQQHRVNGLRHLVVFPMYTQNGSSDRLVEAVLIEVLWPEFVAELEAGDVLERALRADPLSRFHRRVRHQSAVLFPETVAMREIPTFTWGAIFADREAARYRRVVRAAAEITKLELPDDAQRMLDDQSLTERDLRHVGPHPRPHPHAR